MLLLGRLVAWCIIQIYSKKYIMQAAVNVFLACCYVVAIGFSHMVGFSKRGMANYLKKIARCVVLRAFRVVLTHCCGIATVVDRVFF